MNSEERNRLAQAILAKRTKEDEARYRQYTDRIFIAGNQEMFFKFACSKLEEDMGDIDKKTGRSTIIETDKDPVRIVTMDGCWELRLDISESSVTFSKADGGSPKKCVFRFEVRENPRRLVLVAGDDGSGTAIEHDGPEAFSDFVLLSVLQHG